MACSMLVALSRAQVRCLAFAYSVPPAKFWDCLVCAVPRIASNTDGGTNAYNSLADQDHGGLLMLHLH